MRFLSLFVVGVFGMSAQLGAQTLLRELPDGRSRAVAGEPAVKMYKGVPPDAVFRASETSFRQAGIKPQISDPTNFRMLYEASPAGAKVGNLKIENVFDCGGEKDAPLAKTLPLTVSVSSAVRSAVDGSEVVVSVVANPVAVADGTPVPVCKSKGALERKLFPELKLAFVVRQSR